MTAVVLQWTLQAQRHLEIGWDLQEAAHLPGPAPEEPEPVEDEE